MIHTHTSDNRNHNTTDLHLTGCTSVLGRRRNRGRVVVTRRSRSSVLGRSGIGVNAGGATGGDRGCTVARSNGRNVGGIDNGGHGLLIRLGLGSVRRRGRSVRRCGRSVRCDRLVIVLGRIILLAATGVGDTELGRVLVVSGRVLDQLKSVMGSIGLEIGRRSPRVRTRVGDLLDDGGDRNNVGARTTEENKRDSSLRSRLYHTIELLPLEHPNKNTHLPSDLVRLSTFNN